MRKGKRSNDVEVTKEPRKRGAKAILARPFGHVKFASKTDEQQAYLKAIHDNDIVFCSGTAGTGKTYLAVAMALQNLFDQNSSISKLIISRPIIEVNGDHLGALPGDADAKCSPYVAPIVDALSDLIPGKKLQDLRHDGLLEIVPLAYMRGRTFKSAFVILDEAQNATKKQLEMLLTRIGTNSKMVLTGDHMQSDVPGFGFQEISQKLIGIPGIAHVKLTHSSIQRHRLVSAIVERLALEQKIVGDITTTI